MLATPIIHLAGDAKPNNDPLKDLTPFTEKLKQAKISANSPTAITATPNNRPPPPAKHRQPQYPLPSSSPSIQPLRPSPTLEYQLLAAHPSKPSTHNQSPSKSRSHPPHRPAHQTNPLICSTGSRGGTGSVPRTHNRHTGKNPENDSNNGRANSQPVRRPSVPYVLVDLTTATTVRRSFGASAQRDDGGAVGVGAPAVVSGKSKETRARVLDRPSRLIEKAKKVISPYRSKDTGNFEEVSKNHIPTKIEKTKSVRKPIQGSISTSKDPEKKSLKALNAKIKGRLEVAARVQEIEKRISAIENASPPKQSKNMVGLSYDFKKKKAGQTTNVQTVSSISEYFGVRSRVRKIQEESIFYSNSNINLSEDVTQTHTLPKPVSNSRTKKLRNKLLKSYGGIYSTDDTGSPINERGQSTKLLSKSAVSASLSTSQDPPNYPRQSLTVFRPNTLKSAIPPAHPSSAARHLPQHQKPHSQTPPRPNHPKSPATRTSNPKPRTPSKSPQAAIKTPNPLPNTKSTTKTPTNSKNNTNPTTFGLASRVRAQLTTDRRKTDADRTNTTNNNKTTADDYAKRVEEELQAIGHRIDAIIEHSEAVDCSLKLRHSSECDSSSKRLSVNALDNEGIIEIEEAGSQKNIFIVEQRPIFETQLPSGNFLSPLKRKEKHRRAGSSQIDSKSLSDDTDQVQESRSKGRHSVSSQKSDPRDLNQGENNPVDDKQEKEEHQHNLNLESPKFSNQGAANIKIVEFCELGPSALKSTDKILINPDVGWEPKVLAQSAESIERGLSGRSFNEKQMFMTFGLKRSHENLLSQALALDRGQLASLSQERISSIACEPQPATKPMLQSSESQVEWEPYTQSKIDSSANKDCSIEADGGISGWNRPPLQNSHSEKVRPFVGDDQNDKQHNRRPTYQLGEVLDEFVRESEIDDISKHA